MGDIIRHPNAASKKVRQGSLRAAQAYRKATGTAMVVGRQAAVEKPPIEMTPALVIAASLYHTADEAQRKLIRLSVEVLHAIHCSEATRQALAIIDGASQKQGFREQA